MSKTPNYRHIKTVCELPKETGSTISLKVIGIHTEREAERYAQRTGRQVFWIDSMGMAIWFNPLRRESDPVVGA